MANDGSLEALNHEEDSSEQSYGVGEKPHSHPTRTRRWSFNALHLLLLCQAVVSTLLVIAFLFSRQSQPQCEEKTNSIKKQHHYYGEEVFMRALQPAANLSRENQAMTTLPQPALQIMQITFSNAKWTYWTQTPSAKTRKACEHARLFVFVHNRPEAFEVRRAIRLSWARNVPSGVVVKFVLGLRDNDTDRQLLEEQRKHDDLILNSIEDTYTGLFLKAASAFHWQQTFCPRAAYVLKVDDDVTVVLERLLWWMQNKFDAMLDENPAAVFGWARHKWLVGRDPTDKWFLSRKEWPDDHYPTFCPGAAYLLTAAAVRRILDYTPRYATIRHNMEDVIYSGDIPRLANIAVVNASRIFLTEFDLVEEKMKTANECCRGVPLVTVLLSMNNDRAQPVAKHRKFHNHLLNLPCAVDVCLANKITPNDLRISEQPLSPLPLTPLLRSK